MHASKRYESPCVKKGVDFMLVIGKRSASDQQVCEASLGGRSRREGSGEEGGRLSGRNRERFIVPVDSCFLEILFEEVLRD